MLPYAEYLELTGGKQLAVTLRVPAKGTIPHDVIEVMTRNEWSIVRAWREYLGITQNELATRLRIRQPSYVAVKANSGKPKKSTKLISKTAKKYRVFWCARGTGPGYCDAMFDAECMRLGHSARTP